MVHRTQQPNQSPEQPADELLDLIWGLNEGTVEGDGVVRLNELLLVSAANRATYVHFVQVAAWLEYEQSTVPEMVPLPPKSPVASLSSEVECFVKEGMGARRIFPSDAALSAFTVDEAAPASFRKRIPTPSAAGWFALATCAALLVAIASLALRNPVKPVAGKSDASSRPIQEQLDVITVRLATAESRTLPIGDVGTVSIQGPAHLELIGITHARLHQGRIKVRIDDERGHGFVVETPHGRVTDLGTEFGVDVAGDSDTGVVVFEGIVDLAFLSEKDRETSRVERLFQGQGLSVHQAGRTDRIMSIVTGNVTTFQRRGEARLGSAAPVIADVSDNIRSSGFKMFYEIVPAGLHEDALAFADRREHNWNGVDAKGMPRYLIGADYIKPFNSDKMRGDVEVVVTLACPARLFVLLDDRVTVPEWLRADFRDTGDDIGIDAGLYELEGVLYTGFERAEGPGNSIDAWHSVWERIVPTAGVVKLGPNSADSDHSDMYGIAAIPLKLDSTEVE